MMLQRLFNKHNFWCAVYWRAAFIGGRRLLEGGVYWRAAFIGGRRLLEGGIYS